MCLRDAAVAGSLGRIVPCGIIRPVMRLVLALLVIVLGLFASFAIQNPGIVTVKFFTLSGDTSILVVIVAAFGAGGFAGVLPGVPAPLRRQRRTRGGGAGLALHGLDEAVNGFREKGLIEYWELQPAVRLTRDGFFLAQRLSGEAGG